MHGFDKQKDIKAYFERTGLRAKKAFGQNFLIDHNILPGIASGAHLDKNSLTLEIGPGFGVLTQYLIEQSAEVIAVEIDEHLFSFCRDRFKDQPTALLYHEDIMASKHKLSDEIMHAVHERLDAGLDFKVCANLPYKISSSFLIRLIFHPTPPEAMCVLIQEEFADRLLAKPSTKEYGPLSIFGQLGYDCKIIKRVPGSCFYPPPKIGSAVLQLIKKEGFAGFDPAFESFVGAPFLHRRKKIKGMQCRPEELSPQEFFDFFTTTQGLSA